MPRNDLLCNLRFVLEIDEINHAGFSEVTGFDVITDPQDYCEGNENASVRKLPGLTKYGNVTLKRGLNDSMGLYDWSLELINGTVNHKNITIIVRDETGTDKSRFEINYA